jgi:hypothetical protein
MSTKALTAADYSVWTEYAGLYLHNVSHTDRYRTFQEKISAAGLAVKIVFDFLQDNQGGINLQTWRNSYVYEMPADAKWRVEQTARSLEAVGATRIAARMPTLKNTSLGGMLMDSDDPMSLFGQMKDIDPVKLMEEFRGNVARAMPDMAAAAGIPKPPQPPADTDIESWEQIEHLLDRFVKNHEGELRADMAEHGDPRTTPGFDPNARMAELDRLRRAEYDKEAQREDVPKMTQLMETIANQIAENPKIKPGKIAKPRRELLELYRKYAKRSATELLPETQQCVKQVAQFLEKHRDLFQPKPIDDEKLLKRLADFGEYEVDMGNKNVRVTFEAPAGITCDWTTFRLSLQYPLRDQKQLKAMLDTCERVRKNFANHAAELRLQVLESFEMSREHLEHIGLLDDYERDDEGNVTVESILANAGVGDIHLNSTNEFEEGDAIQVYFAIEWDEEHGLQLFIDDVPDAAPEEQAAALANLGIKDCGPSLDAEQIAAFEKEHDVKLPADYRAFLMQHNGGRPEPNHLKLKTDGGPVPVFVDRLFSIGVQGDNDLGNAIDQHRAKNRPAHLAPIGVARMPGPMGESVRCQLVLGLSGKQQGKILVAYDMSAMMMPGMSDQLADNAQAAAMMAAMYEGLCEMLAPKMDVFLSKLSPAP